MSPLGDFWSCWWFVSNWTQLVGVVVCIPWDPFGGDLSPMGDFCWWCCLGPIGPICWWCCRWWFGSHGSHLVVVVVLFGCLGFPFGGGLLPMGNICCRWWFVSHGTHLSGRWWFGALGHHLSGRWFVANWQRFEFLQMVFYKNEKNISRAAKKIFDGRGVYFQK